MPADTPPADAITTSLVEHRLFSIVEEMGEAMLRTAYSQILNSSRDFSCALVDAQLRLVAQAEHVPVHVGAMPWAARAVSEAFAGEIHPGDVFLLNDPYHGGNHLPDLTAFVPVFNDGKLTFWSINRAHQSDIGGATHGAYNPGATEIWQEGIRIPPLKLYDKGVRRDDIVRLLATNVRHGRDFRGDLAAMVGSAKLAERRLTTLFQEFGAARLLAAVEAMLDATERRTRAVVATWQDGVYEGHATLDDDGHGRENIVIRARVTKSGSDLTVDLTAIRSAEHELRQLLARQHAIGCRDGVRLSDRCGYSEERRRVPRPEGDCETRHGRLGERGRARHALHQPLFERDR